MAKKLMFMISTENKSKEQIKQETWAAYQKYLQAEKQSTQSQTNPKINAWVYVIIFIILEVLFGIILTNLFPILDNIGYNSEDETSLASYIFLIPAFIVTYMLYSFIEKKEVGFSKALRLIMLSITGILVSSLFIIPVAVLSDITSFKHLFENLWFIFLIYLGGIITVFFLASILAWLNNSSPIDELTKMGSS